MLSWNGFINPARLWICYFLLLIYGTWFPLTDWEWSLGGISGFLAMDLFAYTTRSDFIINLMIYIPFGFFTVHMLPAPPASRLIIAVLLGGLVSTGLEFGQTFLPARITSLSDIILNTTGTLLGALGAAVLSPWSSPTDTHWRRPLMAITALSGLVALALFILNPPTQTRPYQLPAINRLPAPSLSAFRTEHPRLPAPESKDIATLHRENPAFWVRHRSAVKSGSLYSRILMARVEPDSVQLDQLHHELLQLSPLGRGHEQTIPLALAYDWLFHQWSPSQRAALLEKVVHACHYQVEAIRDRLQLSPYNVQLYNSPLQALMMAALVSYGETDDDSCMRFTADYWKNRVLPVWRQIMGAGTEGQWGGWHEGGEYVGIGIGQDIYQLPALWRHGTGEDLFASEPWLGGFLDFALYRTRPDNTQLRQGDASVFTRPIPDLAALALEYRHLAAYTLAAAPDKPTPTAMPWGPLSDSSLTGTEAKEALPLQRYFAGTGLLVARSDWSRDATYITVKAGNHFWSHSHLDQGAFTIFKGGALAIDSGLYGTRYGSDHHMNYSAQAIAHNVVTVTDPLDRVAMALKKRGNEVRPIANDGGQRRVGSGWGRPAPRDRDDWLRQKSHYQTVGVTLQGSDDNSVWMVADLTPAYTSRLSGKGIFAERTRRVRHYQRTLVYAREQDLVIVYDRIESTHSSFRKAWLLHSIHEPEISASGFVISVPANPAQDMAGGQLRGKVLLPEKATVTKIGGSGFEFFVDGVNYDEGGAVQKQAARKRYAQPGAWRLEIEPTRPGRKDEFLVVMQVGLAAIASPLPPIEITQTGSALTLSVAGEKPVEIVIPRALQSVQVNRL